MGGECSECGGLFGSAEEFIAHLKTGKQRVNQHSAGKYHEQVCSVGGAAIFVSRFLEVPPSASSESSVEHSLSQSLSEELADDVTVRACPAH